MVQSELRPAVRPFSKYHLPALPTPEQIAEPDRGVRRHFRQCLPRGRSARTFGRRRFEMRPTVTVIVLLALQNIGSAQLLSRRPQLPATFELAANVPAELAGKATLTFVDSSVIFDGGSHCARFRRDNGHHLVIFFLHPGYWTKQAIKNETQPIVVDPDNDLIGLPDMLQSHNDMPN